MQNALPASRGHGMGQGLGTKCNQGILWVDLGFRGEGEDEVDFKHGFVL